MRYQAVIFDLDGTLLDTLGDLADSVNHALTAHGFPERTIDEVRAFVGNGIANLIARSVPEGTDPETTAACLSEFRWWYAEHMTCKTAPYAGILELMETLQAGGCRVAVVSNKIDFAVKHLCANYFGTRVDVAIGECEGLRRKPAPDTVNKALDELGVSAEHCVYVGDSDVDIRTAENAGMPCVSVDWGFRPHESLTAAGATTVVSTVEELAAALS